MSHTPINSTVSGALDHLLAQHEGQPSAVVEMFDVAINFVQTQSRLDCDAELQQAITADLTSVREFFAAL